ncbi:hypothetical protein SLA_3790 [Streptomyces laurentii]|uniref:DUF2637 domain-containing protein n=1 Tax=Streptomyces laurentii TaxID=39478 RepID=A0A160P1K0_STRLU|nr:hypothetical protein SLA_3790 [Streptomyces laurentii]
MKLDTQRQVDMAEKVLRLVWVIVGGAILFSVLTVTPLVERVTDDDWDWTAPILPTVVDVAVVITVRVGEIVARLDGHPGRWPDLLRWLTGGMTLLLNIGDSMLRSDWVGVGVHSVAPILLIVTAEAAIGWRRAITHAVARIERERAEEREQRERERQARAERSRIEREEREARLRADRQAAEAARVAERERECEAENRRREEDRKAEEARRTHEAQMERERLAHEAAEAQAAREHEAARRREEQERTDRIAREERTRAEAERARVEAEKKARDDAQRAERERKTTEARRQTEAVRAPRPAVSAAVSDRRPIVSAAVSTPALTTTHEATGSDQMPKEKALTVVREGLRDGVTQSKLAALTGWSTGWVAKQAAALKDEEVSA